MGFYWCPWCIVVLVVVNGVLVTLVGFISNIPMVFYWCIVVLVVVNGVLVTFFGRGCMTRWIQGTTRAIDPRSTLVIIIIIIIIVVSFVIILLLQPLSTFTFSSLLSAAKNTESLKLFFSKKIEIGIGIVYRI